MTKKQPSLKENKEWNWYSLKKRKKSLSLKSWAINTNNVTKMVMVILSTTHSKREDREVARWPKLSLNRVSVVNNFLLIKVTMTPETDSSIKGASHLQMKWF